MDCSDWHLTLAVALSIRLSCMLSAEKVNQRCPDYGSAYCRLAEEEVSSVPGTMQSATLSAILDTRSLYMNVLPACYLRLCCLH